MSTNLSAVDCVISIGDQQITGKGCLVEEFTTRISNNIEQMQVIGSRGIIPIPTTQLYTIDIRLICDSINMHDILSSNFETKKIRNKKVDDCSIQELLYAVRCKLKK